MTGWRVIASILFLLGMIGAARATCSPPDQDIYIGVEPQLNNNSLAYFWPVEKNLLITGVHLHSSLSPNWNVTSAQTLAEIWFTSTRPSFNQNGFLTNIEGDNLAFGAAEIHNPSGVVSSSPQDMPSGGNYNLFSVNQKAYFPETVNEEISYSVNIFIPAGWWMTLVMGESGNGPADYELRGHIVYEVCQ